MADEPVHILIVDDEDRLLRILRLGLRNAGFNVTTAGSGEEALDILLKKDIGLLLTDIRLGGMSGVDLIYELERLDVQLPIIVMTAHADVDTAVKSLKHGANDYIQKPFTVEEVEKLIRDLLAKMPPAESPGPLPSLDEGVSQTEKELILKALEQSGHVKAKAAKLLKVSERTLWNKLKKYDIS
ncbi:MAG: response regulator [Candidatus Omnitrophica bacterium]|nr:response regulator [Candidatus Omnitrophota bacterium]MCB9720276.1 response regulator [Candidatus Omnitrophota bacterium]